MSATAQRLVLAPSPDPTWHLGLADCKTLGEVPEVTGTKRGTAGTRLSLSGPDHFINTIINNQTVTGQHIFLNMYFYKISYFKVTFYMHSKIGERSLELTLLYFIVIL